jgi:hypothetical protein
MLEAAAEVLIIQLVHQRGLEAPVEVAAAAMEDQHL